MKLFFDLVATYGSSIVLGVSVFSFLCLAVLFKLMMKRYDGNVDFLGKKVAFPLAVCSFSISVGCLIVGGVFLGMDGIPATTEEKADVIKGINEVARTVGKERLVFENAAKELAALSDDGKFSVFDVWLMGGFAERCEEAFKGASIIEWEVGVEEQFDSYVKHGKGL